MKHKKLFITLGIVITLVVANLLVGFLVSWETAKAPWVFFSDQILGMKWLNNLIGKAIAAIIGPQQEGSWQSIIANSVQFFIYDLLKITILLCVLIFSISYLQSYFPPERTKAILGKYKGLKANIIGALLGTVTPFCSCSSIPIFIGFTRAGLSSGVTFSFLISSPLVDLASLLLLVSFFGWPIALAYVLVGLILAVIGGTIIEKTKIGNEIEEFVKAGVDNQLMTPELMVKDRLVYARDQVITTYKKVFIYILVGILIGALIHNLLPGEFIATVLGNDSWYGVLLATILGAPMYADIFGTLPVAEALFAKGAGLGSILAFMMSVTALSLPSLIMLRRVVKPKLLAAFIVIVLIGIIIIGYLFNIFGYLLI